MIMKTKFLVFVMFAVIVSWIIELQFNTGYSNENGAPSAVTGSPGDGNKTCAKSGCHTGFTVVNVPNLITSNIPTSGYVPGTTYTITSTCSQPGINKWGFEISPQDLSGNLLGQLIITNTSLTKIKSTKYVTQTTSGSNGNGSKTWSFNWVAPAMGTGDVTFYGSFNYANDNGGDSGDHIKTSTLLVHENSGTTGIASAINEVNTIEVWPNPVRDMMTVNFQVSKPSHLKISLMSLDRKTVKVLTEEMVLQGMFSRQFHIQNEMPAGIYLLIVSKEEGVIVKRIFII